jgi:TRAP transporter TAXI family solute receptor
MMVYLSGGLFENCDKLRQRMVKSLTLRSPSGTQERRTLMLSRLLSVVALIVLGMFATTCGGRVHSAGGAQPLTIRLSTGFPTGNFRPFSEALVKGYARLMPEVRIESVDTRGSLRNIEALEDGEVDLGLAQAGIAYMAYNGRLSESGRALRGIRGIAILNSSAVHLLVGPRSSVRSMDELAGRRVGIGPAGSGAAVVSRAVVDGYFAERGVQEVDAALPEMNKLLLDDALDAAFTISSVPNDDAKYLTDAGARLLPIRGSAVNRLRTIYPFFRSGIIPAGSYRGVDEPVQTLSVDVVLLTRASLDDAVVRRLTEGLFEMLPQLTAELPFLTGMEAERAPATPVPLHPGAALYYRERELKR